MNDVSIKVKLYNIDVDIGKIIFNNNLMNRKLYGKFRKINMNIIRTRLINNCNYLQLIIRNRRGI